MLIPGVTVNKTQKASGAYTPGYRMSPNTVYVVRRYRRNVTVNNDLEEIRRKNR